MSALTWLEARGVKASVNYEGGLSLLGLRKLDGITRRQALEYAANHRGVIMAALPFPKNPLLEGRDLRGFGCPSKELPWMLEPIGHNGWRLERDRKEGRPVLVSYLRHCREPWPIMGYLRNNWASVARSLFEWLGLPDPAGEARRLLDEQLALERSLE